MSEDVVRPGIKWGVFQQPDGRDMHVIPIYEDEDTPMPPHIISNKCICGPNPESNPEFDNTIWVHDYIGDSKNLPDHV